MGRRLAATLATTLLAATGCGVADDDVPASCADRLTGVWRAAEPTVSGQPRRYHVVDRGAEVQLFPMFDDTRVEPELGAAGIDEIAPAVFTLQRNGEQLVGNLVRRYVHRGAVCNARGPASLSRCTGGRMTLWFAAPRAPDDWATVDERPCATSKAAPLELVLTRE